jgi:hypothetical protein
VRILRGVLSHAAVFAGTVVRLTRSPLRTALLGVPGAAGAVLLAYGAWLVYRPAGYLTAGGLLLAFGFEINRTPKPPPVQEPEG